MCFLNCCAATCEAALKVGERGLMLQLWSPLREEGYLLHLFKTSLLLSPDVAILWVQLSCPHPAVFWRGPLSCAHSAAPNPHSSVTLASGALLICRSINTLRWVDSGFFRSHVPAHPNLAFPRIPYTSPVLTLFP